MNSTIATIVLIGWVAITGGVVAWVPNIFSDRNGFLKGFVNHEFLSFMGVVVTITLASSANLFVEMIKLEDREGRDIFKAAKADVRHSAYALVGALVASLVLVIAKPWVGFGARGEAFMNMAAIWIIIFAVMILVDLTQAAFSFDPRQK